MKVKGVAVAPLMGALKNPNSTVLSVGWTCFHWISETESVTCTDLNRQLFVGSKQNTTCTIKVS